MTEAMQELSSQEAERELSEEPDHGDLGVPAVDDTSIPEWVKVPPGLKLPGGGRQVTYVMFRAAWTDCPEKGDRQAILWNLTEADEKFALKRTRGESLRTIDELAKQYIRVVDGVKSNWAGTSGPGSVETFWNDIGAKCRQQLKNLYAKTHMFSADEAVDFFTNCVTVRTVSS
jgi:hypothetical protein